MSKLELNYQFLLNKVCPPNLYLRSNVHLTIKAVQKDYDLDVIVEILKLSPQTKILASPFREKNIDDCLTFARKIIGKCKNGENFRLKFKGRSSNLVSLNEIFFCLLCRQTSTKQGEILSIVLKQNNLAFYYHTKLRIFLIYDINDINQEYCCLYRQKIEDYCGGFYIHTIVNNFDLQLQLKIWQEYLDLVYESKKYVFDCFYHYDFTNQLGLNDDQPIIEKEFWMSSYRKYAIKLVTLWDGNYNEELIDSGVIAEEKNIPFNEECEIEKEYFDIVNPDWRSHLEQMKDLGIRPDYWLTVCVKENPSVLIKAAIDTYRQKTKKRKFVRKPIAYWRHVLNNLRSPTIIDGYYSNCRDGDWIGIIRDLRWGDNSDILVFLSLNSGMYFFAEYHNNGYKPESSDLNLARDLEIGQFIKITTKRNELNVSKIIQAEIVDDLDSFEQFLCESLQQEENVTL